MVLNIRKSRRAKAAGRSAIEQSASTGNRLKFLGEADDVEGKKGSESKDGTKAEVNKGNDAMMSILTIITIWLESIAIKRGFGFINVQ